MNRLSVLYRSCFFSKAFSTNATFEEFFYSQIRLKTTVSAQQIFQSLVRNKQFKFSRVFDIKTNPGELAEQLGNSKNARKFELLISDQRLEDLLRGNSSFEPDLAVLSNAEHC